MSRADAVAPFLAMQMAAKAGAAAAAGRSVVRFDVGQPVGGAPEAALRQLAEALPHDPLGYTDALGSGTLRAAIADHYAARAAAEHSLLAQGKAPPGVKQLKVAGTLAAAGKATV